MPEQLMDISRAKQFLDDRETDGYIWHLIEVGRAAEIWVSGSPYITSLMVVEKKERPNQSDADICIEADSKKELLDLLSVLDPSKRYFAILSREWMFPVFDNELDAASLGGRNHYGLVREDFNPLSHHPVLEFSADDRTLIEKISVDEDMELTLRFFDWTSKSFGIVEDDQLVAYTCTWESGDEREIVWVYTRSDKCRQGYGTSIASETAEYIFQNGGKKVTAAADWDNIGSMRIWEKLGFHREGVTAFYLFQKPEPIESG